MEDKAVAIVPAAGVGKRFGSGTNKPLEILGSKPLLVWALETFEAMPEIKEIIPVIKEADMGCVVDLLEQYRIPKVRRIAPGGRERQESVLHGLNLVEDKKCIVIVHDGVRPLIEPDVVRAAIGALNDCDGVVVGVPVKDTIKEVGGGTIRQTLKRDLLWSIQTPQVFRYETVYNAYMEAEKESFSATDDSALVERYGGKIRVVMGSYANIKITTPEDLMIAELFLGLKGKGGVCE